MKKLMITSLLIFGSLSCQQRCDETTTFEQAIANAKKNKQLTLLAGLRLKGDDTTPQDQWDALVDRIAQCLTESNLQEACANCPFFTELNSIPGLNGSFFIQASDGSCEEETTEPVEDEVTPETIAVSEQVPTEVIEVITDVEIVAPCDCEVAA